MTININEIAKETIVEITKRNLLLTPENYSDVFNEIASKYGRTTHSLDKLQNHISKLNKNTLNDLKARNIKNIDELVVYLISQVNSMKTDNDDKKIISAYTILCKKLLQNLSKFPVRQSKEISLESIVKLNQVNLKTVDEVKNIWLDSSDMIENAFNEIHIKEQSLGIKERDDLLSMLNEIETLMNTANTSDICNNLAPSIAYSLTPSIASSINEEANSFCISLNQDPSLLGMKKVSEQLKDLVKKRIDIDRAEISSSNKVLNEVLEQVSDKIANILNMATSSQEKIHSIKQEIDNIKTNDPTITQIKDKLIAIVKSFESELENLRNKTNEESSILNDLKVKVQGLEAEIEKLRAETQVDFLTQLANKRQLEEQLKLAEESYQRYNINYSIVFFDIDHFKKINDTYGHVTGDTILASLGNIILGQIRKLDCAGRYGGEEFMVILPHADITEALKFAERIRMLVENQKFLVKGKQVNVRVSGGVSDRKSYDTQEQLIEIVDKLLYAAKNAGRNNIKHMSRN